MCRGICKQISEGVYQDVPFDFIKLDSINEFNDIVKIILDYPSIYQPGVKIKYEEKAQVPYIIIESNSKHINKIEPTIIYHGDYFLYDVERKTWTVHKESDFLDHFRIIK